MGQSLSDIDDGSDSGDKYAIFDFPDSEEDVEPEVHPGLNADQMENVGGDFGGDNGSLEPCGLPDDSAQYEAPYEPPSGGGNSGNLPEIIIQLQKQLLKGYTLPPCPTQAPVHHTLSEAEILSLKHYLAWAESHGTVKAYNAHAKVLTEATQVVILSLYKARKLASKLTGIKPCFVDMCPKSCMAFTGKFQSQSTCSYSHNGKVCNEPRYQPNRSSRVAPKARATMLYMPIMPMIQAYYANMDTSHEMRHRDHCLQQTLATIAECAGVKKSEFANSDNHVYHYDKLRLFRDGRDTAISLSSDGAQLTMKKQSNMWLLIVVLLNLSPEICYKSKNVIFPLAIPGPLAPGNIESFIYPLFEEMAQASVGMWTWDAVDSSYFVLRAYLCGVKGDMLGSAKLSGMAGHSALYGDHFSLVQGARTPKDGARSQYYPISPPQKQTYNSKRGDVDLDNLPLRGQRHYWRTIERLESATTKAELQRIVQSTGISCLTMCATSPTFSHPSFFPLDPFHLFYENCMVHIWDLWVAPSSKGEKIYMKPAMAIQLGQWIEEAITTLPPTFSGLVRNPQKKRNSQYKVFEWMALLHWYIIPMAWELEFDKDVLENFAQFVNIVEVAMSHSPKSDNDLFSLYTLVKSFLQGFERLYV